MMAAAVSVPGAPNASPVNDSIAAPIEAGPPGAGVGSIPAYVHALPAAALHGRGFHRARVRGERVGEGLAGGARVVLAREDVHHHVRRFEADRKAPSALPGCHAPG